MGDKKRTESFGAEPLSDDMLESIDGGFGQTNAQSGDALSACDLDDKDALARKAQKFAAMDDEPPMYIII